MLALLSTLAFVLGVFTTPIQHVIVIDQINRTLNSLFNGFPGIYTVTVDPFTSTPITPLPLEATTCTLDHSHTGFVNAYNGGAMNGFTACAYSYVPPNETSSLWGLAATYGLAANAQASGEQEAAGYPDLMYGQEGPRYAIASADDTDNACDNNSTIILTIDLTSSYPGTAGPQQKPCYTYNSVFDEIESAGLTWNYYCASAGTEWCLALTESGIFNTPSRKAHIIEPETQFLADVANGTLANLTFISPEASNSDRSAGSSGGPAWVASIVSAVQASKFWSTTAIFVTWTDGGNWYDPVCGPPRGPYHVGCRVPILVISPYAKRGYIDTTSRSPVSILTFIEAVFNLPVVGSLESFEPDAMMGFFQFGAQQRWIARAPGPRRARIAAR